MTHIKPLVLALGLGLISLSAQAVAQTGELATRNDSTDVGAEAGRIYEVDRVYSFVDPNTQRITALVVAEDRPAVTLSIDRAAQMVHVATSDDRVVHISVADLADAYAQGDAERRAAFLVSMQRDASTTAPAPVCDASDCDTPSERQPTAQLASIVRWAVDHVGSSQRIAQAAEETGDGHPMPAVFDPWQTGTQAHSLLHTVSDFWHLFH
ncbi:MAG: hypothetical protein IT473_05640 [Lysobacter sp.]|nr:hypothetical protein [Lysobacter sp.]